MASFNKVILVGNLTRDVEMRFTPKGTAVGKIGLATNRKWKGEDGQAKEEVTFIDVDCFGKTAEVIAQYCKKGSSLLVEGRLRLDQWEDKQTRQKRSKLGVVLETFTFLGGAQAAPQAQPRSSAPSQSPEEKELADAVGKVDADDDPPF